MNMKINTICFILLFLFLITAVSAAESNNETLKTIKQQDSTHTSYKMSVEKNNQKLEAKKVENDKLESSKKKVAIHAPDVKMYYKDGHDFTITLKDSKNKGIDNQKVKISINGATYTKITNKKGTASINLNFNSGTYNVLTTYDGSKHYLKQSKKSTVTIKSTIKSNDLTKYYKNPSAYYSTFYDKKGNLLKKDSVKFKVNGKSHSVKTNKNGVGKLDINLKPGTYSITSINSKTSESITKTIRILNTLETTDLTMTEKDGSSFNAKVLNIYGKLSPNKKVTFKVNGQTHIKTTNNNGIASLILNLNPGTYTITTEYAGLINTNKITVNKLPKKVEEPPLKKTNFIHSTIIPNYVNVTLPYVFHNSQYSVKTGTNGTVKMPKIEVFTVQVGSNIYNFATGKTDTQDQLTMSYKSYLVPFNGLGMMCSVNKNSLTSDGIMITRLSDCTQIDYRDSTTNNAELIGVYADKSTDNSETLTYMKNDKVVAKVTMKTHYFNEEGVKYSLAKLYQRPNLDFNYYEILNHVPNPIIFTNTGRPVTYSYFTNYIAGYQSKEDLLTKFTVNNHEEVIKKETISYGLSEKYRMSLGFEFLQSYALINERLNKNIVETWVLKNPNYLNKLGIANVYGMFLASLETAWISDEMANQYAKDFNVNWNRLKTITILGGMNLEDTYLHISNADMGMEVNGNKENNELFKLMHSINLPNVEDYVLASVAKRFMNNTSNSQEMVFSSIENNEFSISQIGEMLYLFSGNTSAIVLNTSSGVSNVLLSKNEMVYKGSCVATGRDCCSVGVIPQDILSGLNQLLKSASGIQDSLSNYFKNIHPLSMLAYKGLTFLLGKTLRGVPQAALGLFTVMALIQDGGVRYRDSMISEQDWHKAMDSITFTRPGYLQGKKVYNIPNNGKVDYVEVKINKDLTLNRNSAIYISNGQVKQLTKQETYQYFSEETWTPFSMPIKYWDKSWKGE